MKKKTFAVLYPIIDTYIKSDLWDGLIDYADQNNIILLFFCGSPLKTFDSELSNYNAIYYLLNTKKIDGLISISGILSAYMTPDLVEKFMTRYNDIPIISTSLKFKNHPSITIDNHSAMKQLTDHMIECHHYKKVAFVTGPSSNNEAVDRFNGYKASLLSHHMPLDTSLVYVGTFTFECGYKLADIIYNNDHEPDCVICSNDSMALGLYKRLAERYPNNYMDYRIIGFDNTFKSRIHYPPLTTTEQPTYSLGYEAVKALNKLSKGKNYSSRQLLCKPKYRQSCGCLNFMPSALNYSFIDLLKQNGIDFNQPFDTVFNQSKDTLIQYFYSIFDINPENTTYYKALNNLLTQLHNDIKNHIVEGDFLSSLNPFLINAPELVTNNKRFSAFFYNLNDFFQQCHLDNEEQLTVTKILYLAYTLTSTLKSRLTNLTVYSLQNINRENIKLSQSFSSTINKDALHKLIVDTVKKSNFNTFVVCLFEHYITDELHDHFHYPKTMHTFVSYHNNKHKKQYDHTIFKTKKMLPDYLLTDNNLLSYAFYPLLFRNHHYGYIITDTTSIRSLTFKPIANEINNTLERIILYKEIEDHNSQLYKLSMRDDLTNLYNRRGFYSLGQKLYLNSISKKNSLVVLYIDIDYLKKINDQNGHDIGDCAIRALATILRKQTPKNAIISRIGGDEFTVIIRYDNLLNSQSFIKAFKQKMRLALAKYNQLTNNPYTLSASIGYSILNPNKLVPFEKLLNLADKKLYENKRKRSSH